MKPNSEKAMLKFTEDTFQSVDANKCRFLLDTLSRESIAILDAGPKELDGEAWRMWETKMRYAFYMTINPRFNRKKFASVFGIAYGTARNWKKDKRVMDTVVKLACQFVAAYVGEVEKLVRLPRGKESLVKYLNRRNTALHRLFAEAALYKNNFLVTMLLKTMEQWGREQAVILKEEGQQEEAFLQGKMKELEEVDGADFAFLAVNAVGSFFYILKAFYGLYESPEELEAQSKDTRQRWELYFLVLKNIISRGKTEVACDYVEALQQEVDRLLKDTLFLEKELLKMKAKSGKTQGIKEAI